MNEFTVYRPAAGRWELRCRFLVALAWILGVGMMTHPAALAMAGMALLVMLVWQVVPLGRIFRNLLVVSPFLIVSFVTLSLSDGLPLTREALDFALLIFLRMSVCVLAVCLVTGNDVQDYLNAFRALKFPPVLVSTLFLTQRYVQVIGRQFSATRDALVSRLFSPRLRMKTFKIYGQIFGGMAIHAIDRSEHVRKAMESRGFHGRMRTGQATPIRSVDVWKSGAALLFLALLLLAERLWLL